MSPFQKPTPTHRHQSTRALMAFTAIAGILAITLQACGGGGGDTSSSGTPPVSNNPSPTAATFNVKSADLLYTTAQPISISQLQTGLSVKNPALPIFVSAKNATVRNGLVAGVAANSSAFNLVTVGSDGMSSQTIQSQYLNRVLYTASPPNFDLINGRALADPHVYIAFTADPYAGDTVDYSEFIAKNTVTPCALYRVNTNTNEANCALPNVEPMAYFDENRNWGLFDGGNRKPIQFDAQGNIYVAGYPFTVNNGKVLKRSTATLYKLQANTFAATALTQDNESVIFFTMFPNGEPVVAIKGQQGTDLVLYRDNSNGTRRFPFATNMAEPFVNTDTFRTLIYGSASGGTKGINLVRTSIYGVDRATLDYNSQAGTNYNLQAGGKTYSGLVPRRIISGDDGKFYTVYSASDSNQNNVLLVYQTLPFAKNAVAVIPVTGEWWTWMKNRPIQIKRGILYYADVQDRTNIGTVDIIKVVRLRDGTVQSLFASKNYRIDSWRAQGDTLHFSGIDNDTNQLVQGQINTKSIALHEDWSTGAWLAFSPSNVKPTASATAASLRIQDMESLHPQQPQADTGGQPGILGFDSTDKAASINFTKYMSMSDVESKLLITSQKAGVAAPGYFALWSYQNLHLVYDTSSGLTDNVTSGLPVGAGSFVLESTDSLPDAYGWSVPKAEFKYTVFEKQNEMGVYSYPVLAGLSIATQPSNQTVIAGSTATFAVTVTASGSQPITYQWKKNGVNIAGATQSSYTTPATTALDDDASFSVEVKNASGTLPSNTAKLGVTSPPAVLTQPTAQTVTQGQAASFSVTASGSPLLRYQWKKNGADIADANSSSYSTPATLLSDNGAIYSVQISNDAGSVSSSGASLTVIAAAVAPAITAQPGNLSVVAGLTATFSVTATGTSLSYQWKKNGTDINGATSSSYTTAATSIADSGAEFIVVVSNSAGSATSNSAILTVNAAAVSPSITTQPVSQTVTAGQTASFSVSASGTAPLTYQWRKNGSNISGATSSTYTTPATAVGDSGAVFSVVVSNAVGSATSSNATLTVNAAPVSPSITTQPASQTVTAGQTATFSVTASGTAPLTYQWKKNGSNISGATSSTYTTSATAVGDNGSVFIVVISNAASTVTSTDATLTVNAPSVSPSITTQPGNQTVTAGQTASFSVSASGTAPLTYQWRKNGSNISGATSSTYTPPATVVGDSGAVFSVVVSNAVGSATSSNATLTVNAAPVSPSITTQPASQTVTAGQTATFSVTASGTAPLTYQWRKNGSNISGATSSTYTTPATAVGDNGSVFIVVISNAASTVTSTDATLTVNAPSVSPSITTQPGNQTVTAGQTASFSVSASGTAPLTYQWRKNGSSISGATSSTYTTPATAVGDSGALFTVVVSNAVGNVTSSSATLTVNAVGAAVAPAITVQPADQLAIGGQTATFSVTASGTAPLSYQWKRDDINISGATSSTYTTPVTSLADSGAVFTVTVSNSVGGITSNGATMTVKLTPTISTQPASQDVIVGGTVSFAVVASGTGPLSYQWRKNGSNISGATSSSYTTPAAVMADSGAIFTVVVSNAVGTVSSSNAILTVSTKYRLVANGSGGTYAKTECVKDSSTGLFWEGKTASGSRLGTSTYTNYDSTSSAQKSNGTSPTQTEVDASTNSIGYVNSVNAGSGLCGFTDWRMPTSAELQGILASSGSPRIDTTWFPNTQAAGYWSSSPYVGSSNVAWDVYFGNGNVGYSLRSSYYHVRLVR